MDTTWTTTRSQLIDALANIEVRGVQLPGQTKAAVVADDMADAILEQLPGGDGSVTVSREDLRVFFAKLGRGPSLYPGSEAGQAP